jgi:hypothetical protein
MTADTSQDHTHSSINKMAASATLHCLTGCAIGEVGGLVVGTAFGLANSATIVLSIILAFIFGFTLSTLPLLKAGLAFFSALSLVAAADSLSIFTMEVFDNLVMLVIPGAMNATLASPLFWISLGLSLAAAFIAAWPVNRYLLARNKGHALTMQYHHRHKK